MFVFFFLMLRRPPRSTRTDTLFPYTTLFRSPTCVVEPTTWQALPAMLLVERSGFGLNELLDRAPITGTAACLEQQAAASIAEEKSPRPKYGRSSRCDQDLSRSLARTRPEESPVGKECGSPCRSRWWPFH